MRKLIVLVSIVFIFSACDQHELAKEPVIIPGKDEVVARVNGSDITRYQVNQTKVKVLGIEAAANANKAVDDNILESLITMRAVSQAAENKLSPEELFAIDQKAQAHKEELLLKSYISRYGSPEPISKDMIKQYYDQHPEKFGGQSLRRYEMLFSSQKLHEAQRDSVMNALNDLSEVKDWAAHAKKISGSGVSVEFRSGNADEVLLQEQLKSVLRSLKLNEVSKPFFMQGKLYIVKIVSETAQAARPLNEVSGEIRKLLAPRQVQKMIKRVSDEVVKQAKIEYINHKADE